MNLKSETWEERCKGLWNQLDQLDSEQFINQMKHLVSELSPQEPIGYFELACAQDSTGHSDIAIPLYEKALSLGLSGIRRRRAVIQMSSSLRNIGKPEFAIKLLSEELLTSSDELDGAVHAFLALALADIGNERLALQYSLKALAKYLPRYNRSLANYADLLIDENASNNHPAG